jgi:FlaA1/EpsC-like NDP-sugar epimerase
MPSLNDMRFKQLLVVLTDAVLITASLYIAYALRFNTVQLDSHWSQIIHALPIILGVRLTLFVSMGLYRGMWRFVGMRDLVVLIQAVTISSALSVGLLFLFFRLANYPRSVFIIDWFVVIVLIGGSRFAYRLYREGGLRLKRIKQKGSSRVLIIGAGRAGDLILREILRDHGHVYTPVGFVDDDRKKRNMTIHGYRVLGNTRDIQRIAAKHDIDEILLAIPSAPAQAKRRIVHTCTRARIKFKTLPSVGDLLKGTVTVNALREFQIEDLLGREPVKLDTAAIKQYLRDKTVMITGAGGSIGSELCRQVAQFSPRRLVLYEQSEFNLYQIEMLLADQYPEVNLCPIIGDVLNRQKVERTLGLFKPDVVFHAAAYKHVPLMELNPEEALRTNVLGTWTMASLSHECGVSKFVMVSTDKAVRPTNIMGASKRIAEIICQGFARDGKTKFVTVRFGNVLNSVGSVIPLFKSQIAKGGPVTVTHPEIYRYFMTIPEAAQLIMQAGAMGQGGEIFILDMGEPIKIVDLAKDMITLSGLEPDKDIKIVFAGLRPGEKLYEELLMDGEEVTSTIHQKIKVAAAEKVDWRSTLSHIEQLLASLQDGMSGASLETVKRLVPEYQSNATVIEGQGSVFEIAKLRDSNETADTSHFYREDAQ